MADVMRLNVIQRDDWPDVIKMQLHGEFRNYVPERTCRFMPAGGEDDKPRFEQMGNCSECFGMMYGSDSYCPDCGARVVE